MDRTAWIAIIICSIGIVFFYHRMSEDAEALRKHARAAKAREAPEAPEQPVETSENGSEPGEGSAEAVPAELPAAPSLPEEEMVLENDFARFEFTHLGAGVRTVTLEQQQSHQGGKITINKHGLAPIGALTRSDSLDEPLIAFVDVSKPEPNQIRFSGINDAKIQITKTYTAGADPHELDLEIRMTNTSDVPHESSRYSIHTGALGPMHTKESSFYLLYNWGDMDSVEREMVKDFDGGGWIFKKPPRDVIGKTYEGLEWTGPSNQFFLSAVIDMNETSANRFWSRRTPIEITDIKTHKHASQFAIYGGMALPEIRLAPGASETYRFKFYTGPKELSRLQQVDHNLEGVMHYDDMPILGGMFGLIPLISKSLLKLMIFLQSLVHNWGVAILIITCLIRLLIWPLHAKSTNTMKRMSKLTPLMNELREKYKDDPQRMQQETMKLYRDYGINPLGGCLPVFLQLPIFLGFYKMLQSAVELRNKEFLWVNDLSMPDSVYEFADFSLFGVSSINLMPLLMAATMIIQMKVGPKAGDKMQQRIFMLMPLIFLFICYNFASALALYWTGQNIFSIGQTWLMNRRPEPELKKRPKPDRRSLMQAAAAGYPGQKKKPKKKRAPRTGG